MNKIKYVHLWYCDLYSPYVPFVYDSRTFTILLTQIFIFAIFAMSYDILLGFTGIVSFGHAMFFGIGAYSIGIFMKSFEPTMWLFLYSRAGDDCFNRNG